MVSHGVLRTDRTLFSFITVSITKLDLFDSDKISKEINSASNCENEESACNWWSIYCDKYTGWSTTKYHNKGMVYPFCFINHLVLIVNFVQMLGDQHANGQGADAVVPQPGGQNVPWAQGGSRGDTGTDTIHWKWSLTL